MRLPHVTPFSKNPLYFFTACTLNREPLLANAAAFACLSRIWRRSAELDGWFVGRFVIMPDHVHFFAMPAVGACARGAWLKMMKSVSSRELRGGVGEASPVWQPDTFDHILRSADSYSEKWEYVRLNPVRRALVERPEDWPWQGEIHSLAF